MKLTEAEILGLKFLLVNTRSQIAILLDKFHLTLDQIARLTDRQIDDYYFHPRDQHGAIKPIQVLEPAAPLPKLSYEEELRNLEFLNAAVGLQNFEQAKKDLYAKFHPEGANGQ